MKRFFLALMCLSFYATAHAQSEKPYFQQQVNYDIEATLDDKQHMLTGYIDMEYTNNSPDALNEIYMHLWPNAYRNRRTAFAKQALDLNKTQFNFADNSKLGGLKDLAFLVNDESVEWDYYQKNWDIALIKLKKPLPSGGKVTISTPFTLKIPDSFSRLGHVGQSYQMTQWFPKPAVYDRNGWHPMPYLDMGEFYSEFGNFDVKITLPSNYVVGATGVLQNEDEVAFLNQKAREAAEALKLTTLPDVEKFPDSSETTKTLHYIAENVHDFAWFADKRFYVLKDVATLPSGKKVDAWAMFNAHGDVWKDGAKFVKRAVEFYSDKVGEYPWPHATAVFSALSAGGGMEYPMITVIGRTGSSKDLDLVITHEVGHNWFYGILASNERDYPWMDEGMNSYYENRYMQTYYEGGENIMERVGLPKIITNGLEKKDLDMLPQEFQMRRHQDQPVELSSDEYTYMNYGLIVYDKTARLFKYLEEYLGTESFDKVMHAYYAQWSFKHPYPKDVQAVFERETGKDWSWFFGDWLKTTKKVDYEMDGLANKDGQLLLTVENEGSIAAPFPITAYKDGQLVATQWYEGIPAGQEKEVSFPSGDYDKLAVNGEVLMPEYDRRNNYISATGKTSKPLSVKFLTGPSNPEKNTLYVMPLLAFNNYDKAMIGLNFSNSMLPPNPLEYSFAPFFALGSKEPTGTGFLDYHIYPEKGAFGHVTLGVEGRRFNQSYNGFYKDQNGDPYFSYMRLTPKAHFELRKKSMRDPVTHTFDLRSSWTSEQSPNSKTEMVVVDNDTTFVTTYLAHKNLTGLFTNLTYTLRGKDALQPYSIGVLVEHGTYTSVFDIKENYIKATLETNYRYTYKPKKALDLRFYVGTFLTNTRKGKTPSRGALSLITQGRNDYDYSDFYFGRNDAEGIWSQQVQPKGGFFKTPGVAYVNGGFGESNDFVLAVNFKVDLPMDFPNYIPKIRPYFDAGYFKSSSADATFEDQLVFNGGIGFEYLNGAIGVYLPFVGSDNVMNALKSRGDFGKRIAFVLDLKRLNPSKVLQNIDF
jgi:hypothetical protein